MLLHSAHEIIERFLSGSCKKITVSVVWYCCHTSWFGIVSVLVLPNTFISAARIIYFVYAVSAPDPGPYHTTGHTVALLNFSSDSIVKFFVTSIRILRFRDLFIFLFISTEDQFRSFSKIHGKLYANKTEYIYENI